MSSFIQINIYNQNLETLKLRGIDLKAILKTIDCHDTWITEVPIIAPKPREVIPPSYSFTSSEAQELTSPLKRISSGMSHSTRPPTLKELFDDWDPVMNLPSTSAPDPGQAPAPPPPPPVPTLSSLLETTEAQAEPEDPVFKTPKEEPLDEDSVEANDSELANEEERKIIQELLSQKAIFDSAGTADALKSRRQLMSEDPDISNTVYSISCCFPGCTHQYNWRVKYGKLRLLDHALTHCNRTIPCKLCGFNATNVRRIRSHYAKEHPTERVQGYGMKALVSGADESEEELKDLWMKCYLPWIGLIGEACGSEGYRRNKKIKLDDTEE